MLPCNVGLMTVQTAQIVEGACTELQSEVWECRSCGDSAPCRVEITFSTANMPEHIKGKQRFSCQVCLCAERAWPRWNRMQ